MIPSPAASRRTDVSVLLRGGLLALFVLGGVGLVAELYLLDHFEEWRQWLPFAALTAGLPLAAWAAVRPSRGILLALRSVCALTVAIGLLGLWFHFSGNREFELEMDRTLSGSALIWEALTGATPALAPGALVQLGLLGLLATWRHPVFSRN